MPHEGVIVHPRCLLQSKGGKISTANGWWRDILLVYGWAWCERLIFFSSVYMFKFYIKCPVVFQGISFCITIQSFQLTFVITNSSTSRGKYPYRPKPLTSRWVELDTVVVHETNLKSTFSFMELVYMDMSVLNIEINCFFYQEDSTGSSSFCMIFYAYCIRDYFWIRHGCTGCQLWIIITGQEFISYPACKNSTISFSLHIHISEKLLSHCLPPLRKW